MKLLSLFLVFLQLSICSCSTQDDVAIIRRSFEKLTKSLRLLSVVRLPRIMMNDFKIIDCYNVEKHYSPNDFMNYYVSQSQSYAAKKIPEPRDIVANHTAGTLKFVTQWESVYNEYTLLKDGDDYKFAVEKHLECQSIRRTSVASELRHDLWKMNIAENLFEHYKKSHRDVATLFTHTYTLADGSRVKRETLAERQSNISLSMDVVKIIWPRFNIKTFRAEAEGANYGYEFKIHGSGPGWFRLQSERMYYK